MGGLTGVWDFGAGLEGERNKGMEAMEGVLLRAWALGKQRRFSELNLLGEVVGNRHLTWRGCTS